MPKLKFAFAGAVALYGASESAAATPNLQPNGGEYRILRSTNGDQGNPSVSFGGSGGYLVTEDTLVDGSGLGVRARRFFADLSGSPGTFQVNSTIAGDQKNARVAALPDGGAAFTWQGSVTNGHRIFARFVSPAGVFYGQDLRVSLDERGSQQGAVPTVLTDGSVLIVWSAWNREPGAFQPMQGVFGQRFDARGNRIGSEFQINVTEEYNQRNPTVAALPDGGFVVAWVSENSSREYEDEASGLYGVVDIHARIFNANQVGGSVFRLNELGKICANPSVAAVGSEGFRVAWTQRAYLTGPESWDVVGRSYDRSGGTLSAVERINGMVQGDQFVPTLATLGTRQLAVWTSYGQDGYDEGVYGRMLTFPSGTDGDEFRVNSTTVSKQLQPTVSTFGEREFVVAWTSFTGGGASFDLFAQRYQVAGTSQLPQPESPMLSALSQNSLCVTWPEIPATSIDTYILYVDGSEAGQEVSGGMQVISSESWVPASTHSVQIAYRLKDGRLSPRSAVVSAQTWGEDKNSDGLPDNWQTENWGKQANWPLASADNDGDGASNLSEFYAGTDPSDPSSVLRTAIGVREQGLYFEWNTQPGNVYQVQVTTDFKIWDDFGSPRFAASTNDAIPVSGPTQNLYYRVIRLR